jgi:hypothetical protein
MASQPDFAEYALDRFKPGAKPIRGSCIFLAKVLASIWSHKESDLAKIWFIDKGP